MVGAVPFVKRKAFSVFALLATLFCAAFAAIGAWFTPWLMENCDEERIVAAYFMFLGLGIYLTWHNAIKRFKAMKVSIGLTTSGKTSSFVRERAGN